MMNPDSTAYPPSRILCIDDDAQMLETLRIGLETYGFCVIGASDGIEALTQFQAHLGDLDAIVTDHDMPRMGGLQFLQAVHKMGFAGRIVVMSGNLSVKVLNSYQDLAVTGFFHKPFEVSLLATMLLAD
jgi:two-component system cell cycle sensor histidine kinase/response regulator CckA